MKKDWLPSTFWLGLSHMLPFLNFPQSPKNMITQQHFSFCLYFYRHFWPILINKIVHMQSSISVLGYLGKLNFLTWKCFLKHNYFYLALDNELLCSSKFKENCFSLYSQKIKINLKTRTISELMPVFIFTYKIISYEIYNL